MEKSNQHPKTEGCLAEGAPDLLYFRRERPSRSVPREKREPQAGPASRLSNSASREQTASGDGVSLPEPNTSMPVKGEGIEGLPGSKLRAWRALKQTHGTEEARTVPAALTTRAKQERRRNDRSVV